MAILGGGGNMELLVKIWVRRFQVPFGQKSSFLELFVCWVAKMGSFCLLAIFMMTQFIDQDAMQKLNSLTILREISGSISDSG